MAKKTTDVKVEEVVKVEIPIETLILRPRIKLTIEEFKVLEGQVKAINEESGIEVILIPYSCEVVEDDR